MKIYPFCDDQKLLIEFTNKERAELQEEFLTFPEKFHDMQTIEDFLLEPAIAYGYVFFHNPEAIKIDTESPILQVEYNEKKRFYFRRFDEVSPLEDLLNLGFCVFHHVSEIEARNMTEIQKKNVDELEENGWTLMVVEKGVALLANYDTGEWLNIHPDGSQKESKMSENN